MTIVEDPKIRQFMWNYTSMHVAMINSIVIEGGGKTLWNHILTPWRSS